MVLSKLMEKKKGLLELEEELNYQMVEGYDSVKGAKHESCIERET